MADFKNQNMTEQDGDCLKDVFDLFDRDKDGEITIDDLDKVMRSHGYVHSTKELQQMILRIDKNFSGSVGFEEFLELEMNKEEVVEDDIVQVFKMFDKNGDGRITAEEVRSTMKELGEDLSAQEVHAMLLEADMDGDGQIDIHEFSRLMECFGK